MTVAVGCLKLARAEPVGCSVVPDAAPIGGQPVDTVPGCHVDPAREVFGDALHGIAGETLGGANRNDTRVRRSRIVDAAKATFGAGDPEPAGAVDIQVIDVARRQPVGLREKFKAAVAIASQPAIEADPEGALAVLAKDLSQAVRNRGMIAERAGRPHPLAEAIAGAAVRGGGKPDIAGGVLEQAEHVVRYQPVPRIVKRLRGGASQLFDACDLGEAQQPGAGGNPPFTRAILKRRLVPTPAEVMDGGGKLGLRRPKALAIQPVDPQPMEFLAQDTEVSRQVFEDRGDVRIVDAIGQPISSEAPAGNLDGAIKIASRGFTTYGLPDGIHDPNITSIFGDLAGDLCVLSEELHGLWINRLDGQRFRAAKPKFPPAIHYFGWGWNQTALQDRAGEWWIATGAGLLRFPKVASIEQLARTSPKAFYNARNGLVPDDVFRLFEDSAGDIWFSTAADRGPRNGLSQWMRATGSFRDHSSVTNSLAKVFRQDRQGALWIGFNSGLARYRNGRFEFFTEADGLPAGDINDLYVDRSGRLWIASA